MEKAERVEAVFTAKRKLNHDCYIFSFRFTGKKIYFGIGQFFRIIKVLKTYDHPEGEELARKYTIINPCSETDTIDFLVKIYRPNVQPNFPQGGKYTPFLETQQVGDKMIVEGPYGRFGYEGNGIVSAYGQKHERPVKRIFFMAGGSGITPIYQILIEFATNKENIELILLFANRREEDIVMRQELESHKDRIKLHYILDQPPANWPFFKGHINHQILTSICPLDDPDTMYAHCGPKGMTKVIQQIFQSHYPKSFLFKF